jgi:hypothetical protein
MATLKTASECRIEETKYLMLSVSEYDSTAFRNP